MEADLYSFKVIIHKFSVERFIFNQSYLAIENPAFAIRFLDLPTFLIYSQERITSSDVRNQQFIRLGKGKNTQLERKYEEIVEEVKRVPMILSFVDASNSHLKVFGRAIVDLSGFLKGIESYANEKAPQKWKRNIFLLNDEAQNMVGSVDMSVCFSRKQRTLNEVQPTQLTKTITQNEELSNQQEQYLQQQHQQTNEGGRGFNNSTKDGFSRQQQQFNKTAQGLQRKNEGATVQFALTDHVQDIEQPYRAQRPNTADAFHQQRSQQNKDIPVQYEMPTLKTIVESHYCPPIMYLKKEKSKTMAPVADPSQFMSTGGGHHHQKENYNSNYGGNNFHRSQTTANDFNGHKQRHPRPALRKSSTHMETGGIRLDTHEINQAFDTNGTQAHAQTGNQLQQVIVLNNQESKTMLSDLGLLKEGQEVKPGVLDLLINELVALRTGNAGSTVSFAQAGTPGPQQTKSPRSKSGFFKKSQTDEFNSGTPARRESVDSQRKSSITRHHLVMNDNRGGHPKNNESTDMNTKFNSRQSREMISEVIKTTGRDSIKHNDSIKDETIIEDYTNDFESLSVSQNISSIDKAKSMSKEFKNELGKNKNFDPQASNISESYPEDFENVSGSYANISKSLGKSKGVESNNSAMTDDYFMSSSINKYNERITNTYKKNESRISEYTEDFEELSDEYYE